MGAGLLGTAGLRLEIERTANGRIIRCPSLDDGGQPWVRCVRDIYHLGRIIDEAWLELDRRTREAQLGRYRQGRNRRNPGEWRRLAKGEALWRDPVSHHARPCPEGSWLSPAGHVYHPDSKRVPKATRDRYVELDAAIKRPAALTPTDHLWLDAVESTGQAS